MAVDSPPAERDISVPSLDGLSLSGRRWSVEGPRGVLIVVHGLGEHGGGYRHVAEALCRSVGIDLVAVDLRGHGRSPGRRGVVRRYEELCDDLRAVVAWVSGEYPRLPRFVLGHSNGGQVVLRAALDALDVDGLLLSNPALRVAKPIPRWKRGVGRFLETFAPQVTLTTAIDLSTLTRDPAMIEERRGDPLRHARVNGPLFFGLVEGGKEIAQRAEQIRLPLLMILGEADPIIDPKTSESLFRRFGSADKTLRIYPGMLHEPLNELGRDDVLDEVGRWLRDRLPGEPPA